MPTVNYGQVRGPKGDTGATGNGIVSVTLLSGDHSAGTLDTCRITFADATTFDFEVYNGADGEGGGDMEASVYDPTNQAADAFSMANMAEDATHKVMTGDERTKLAGIVPGANNYTHPANHAPSVISQDASNRFVTDAEKASWSAPNVLTAWRADISYPLGVLAIDSDGTIWQSLVADNLNNSPTIGDYWGWPQYYAQSMGVPGQVLRKYGSSWDSYDWSDLVASLTFVIDGGGSAITTGIKGDIVVPFACTIQSATLLADQSGSIVVNIWKDIYATYPPTVADKITASAPPTLTTAIKSQDTTLTGWTKAIAAGDTLRFNVDSAATVTRVTLALKVVRT